MTNLLYYPKSQTDSKVNVFPTPVWSVWQSSPGLASSSSATSVESYTGQVKEFITSDRPLHDPLMLIHCLTRTVITTFYLANRSRQQWYGNPEPEHQGVVATEIAHVWPGVGCGWWCNWGLDMVMTDDVENCSDVMTAIQMERSGWWLGVCLSRYVPSEYWIEETSVSLCFVDFECLQQSENIVFGIEKALA